MFVIAVDTVIAFAVIVFAVIAFAVIAVFASVTAFGRCQAGRIFSLKQGPAIGVAG